MAKKKKSSNAAVKGVGAAVVVAFLIGMYSGIPGFGGGEGAQGNASAAAAATGGGPVETADDLTKTGLEDNVLTVLIDGHEYAVLTKRDGQEEYRAASVDQVVSLAKIARGDDTGVRVKVLRRESARASAEEQLRGSLVNAGIPAPSIYWPNRFLP
jgi:hypothetical protein